MKPSDLKQLVRKTLQEQSSQDNIRIIMRHWLSPEGKVITPPTTRATANDAWGEDEWAAAFLKKKGVQSEYPSLELKDKFGFVELAEAMDAIYISLGKGKKLTTAQQREVRDFAAKKRKPIMDDSGREVNLGETLREAASLSGEHFTGPHTVYVKKGRLAGKTLLATKNEDTGDYYYFNPDTGTDEYIGDERSVDVEVSKDRPPPKLSSWERDDWTGKMKPMSKRTFQHNVDLGLAETITRGERSQMSSEELQGIWEDDKSGEYIQLSDDGSAWYIAHGRAMEQIAPPTSQQTTRYGVGGDTRKGPITKTGPVDSSKNTFKLISQWFKSNNIFLNIWQVNERGNLELYSSNGKALGGLVESSSKETITRSELKEVIKATLRTILLEMNRGRQVLSMLEEGPIPLGDLRSAWREDQSGEYVQINPDDSVSYVARGRANQQVVPRGVPDPFPLIANWMQRGGVILNIWKVDDQGKLELMSRSGKPLGGLAEQLYEMTTTGAVAPINLPGNVKGGWVASRGGSARGVAGSKSLGYELTPIGKSDMARKQDPVY